MIRRPPRSTLDRSSAASDVYKRQGEIATGTIERIEHNGDLLINFGKTETILPKDQLIPRESYRKGDRIRAYITDVRREKKGCLLYTSPSPRDRTRSRMPSSA